MPDPLPPTIGPFRILAKLGEGGMGIVYAAEQSEPRRRIALKVMKAAFANDPEVIRNTLAVAERCNLQLAFGRPLLPEFPLPQGVADADDYLRTLPTRWPTRRVEDREVPLVTPTVRTAAVDPSGELWVSFVVPYTYVYDAQGDKTRTVQFQAAGTIAPTSLFFSATGRLLVTPGCYEFDPGHTAR